MIPFPSPWGGGGDLLYSIIATFLLVFIAPLFFILVLFSVLGTSALHVMYVITIDEMDIIEGFLTVGFILHFFGWRWGGWGGEFK